LASAQHSASFTPWNLSAQRFKRVLTEYVELHGEIMRKGDKVALAYGAANRDPRKFAHPDVYDVERNPRAHLGFGAGPHFCLGSHMARLVTATAMRAFLEAVPNFERQVAHWRCREHRSGLPTTGPLPT
jgi:cytochrome P450